MKTKLLTLLLFALCSVSFAQKSLFREGFYVEPLTGMVIFIQEIRDKEYVVFSLKHKPVKAVEEKGMLKICVQTPCSYFQKTETGIKITYDEGTEAFFERMPEVAWNNGEAVYEYGYKIKVNCCGYLVVVREDEAPGYEAGTEGCGACY